MANQPNIVVLEKQRMMVIVIDVAISSDSNIRKKEHETLEAEKRAREDTEGDGNSSSCGNQNTWDTDPQTGRVSPAERLRHSQRHRCEGFTQLSFSPLI